MTTTQRHGQREAAAALVGNMDAKTRRLVLHLLWWMTPRSQRSAAGLKTARAYAPKSLKGLAEKAEGR